MMQRSYYVYIVASEGGTLYLGVTNDLRRRVHEHKQGAIEGFTKKYGCKKLVYFEATADIRAAIEREKALKKWNRERKETLVRELNPKWRDLSLDL